MNRGWLELESDPGLFSLLIEDFGTQGVQVEEIYDLQKHIEGPVYGFIFLFKWIEERRSRRKVTNDEESFVTDEEVLNSMFFAKQIIANSCATHALLSVLLNCDQKLKLGDTLTGFKEFCHGMSSEDKGYAIGNMPDLAKAHNSHARPEPAQLPEKQQGVSAVRTMEAFHFVSYVPVNGRLYELDGLKPYPIDHGPIAEGEEWTEKFRHVITERLGMATGGEPYHDIRFNLMAVVPDRRQQYEHKLKTLKTNRQIVLEALQQMVNVTNPDLDPNCPKPEPAITRSRAAKAAEAVKKKYAPPPTKKLKTRSTVVNPPKLPAALDSHNYAKSPILECVENEVEMTEVKDEDVEDEGGSSDVEIIESTDQPSAPSAQTQDINDITASKVDMRHLRKVRDKNIKIHIAVNDEKEGSVTIPTTVALTDVTKPLTIQTKFTCSPIPSFESTSTDTASECGSAFNSPNTSISQAGVPVSDSSKAKLNLLPKLEENTSIEKEENDEKKASEEKKDEGQEKVDVKSENRVVECVDPENQEKKQKPKDEKHEENKSRQAFTPKDLLALLKNVENEITTCEANLRDEVEKKKKYKIDDSHRTHNYDQFICTFLSMLAQQGKLTDLVEQHMLIKRRQGVNVGRLNKNKKPDKRKRARSKKKR